MKGFYYIYLVYDYDVDCSTYICTLGILVQNMKMDFNTGGIGKMEDF